MVVADNAIDVRWESGEGWMRLLKALTIGMGVLIVVATTVLVVLIARRLGGAGSGCRPRRRWCWTSRGNADRGDRRGRRSVGGAAAGWRCRIGLCCSTHGPARWLDGSGCGRQHVPPRP